MAVRAIDAVLVLHNINLHRRPTPVSEFESGFNNGLNQAMWEIAHAPTLTQPNEWVSVEERLPDKMGEYIVHVDGKVTRDVYCVCDGVERWLCYNGTLNALYIDPYSSKPLRDGPYPRVTHWMHLPQPPKEEKKSD